MPYGISMILRLLAPRGSRMATGGRVKVTLSLYNKDGPARSGDEKRTNKTVVPSCHGRR